VEVAQGVGDGGRDFGGVGGDDQWACRGRIVVPVVFGGIRNLAEPHFQPVDHGLVALGGGGFGVEVVSGGVGVVAQFAHQRLVGVAGGAFQQLSLLGQVSHNLIAVRIRRIRQGLLLAREIR